MATTTDQQAGRPALRGRDYLRIEYSGDGLFTVYARVDNEPLYGPETYANCKEILELAEAPS